MIVPAVSTNSLPNQPQDMQIWIGIVLMAIVPQSTALVKNGVRYKVLRVEGDNQFELVAINDDDAHTAASFIVDKKEFARISVFRLKRERSMAAFAWRRPATRTLRCAISFSAWDARQEAATFRLRNEGLARSRAADNDL